MKIELDTEVKGKWGKAGKEIKDGDRLKVLDAGQTSEGSFGTQYIFKVLTKDKEEFNVAFNRTSRNTLGRGFGTETEDWVGKVIKAFVVKQMVGDGLKNVLYLAPDGWIMTDDGEFMANEENDEPEAKQTANTKAKRDYPEMNETNDAHVDESNPF